MLWEYALRICFENMLWEYALRICIENMHWECVIENMPWEYALRICLENVSHEKEKQKITAQADPQKCNLVRIIIYILRVKNLYSETNLVDSTNTH